MDIHRLETAQDVADAAAEFLAARMRDAVARRGWFTLALSGGSTPWKMMKRLAELDLPWELAHVFQVDERVAPRGNPDRNLTQIREKFADRVGLPPDQLHAMPVEGEDLDAAAAQYSELIDSIAGSPAVLDLVHLGMGADGHTASLLPGDGLLRESAHDIGVTPPYQGRPRMTLTFPILNRARHILWLVTGADKAIMLDRMIASDPEIPAGRVNAENAVLFTDIQAPDDKAWLAG